VTAIPDKTFIGWVERGFDFLGYHFGPEGLTMAARTIERFVVRAIRLWEQEPGVVSKHAQFGMKRTYIIAARRPTSGKLLK
jgi:hypothetical protein